MYGPEQYPPSPFERAREKIERDQERKKKECVQEREKEQEKRRDKGRGDWPAMSGQWWPMAALATGVHNQKGEGEGKGREREKRKKIEKNRRERWERVREI